MLAILVPLPTAANDEQRMNAYEVARLGGVGHISDAMIHSVSDRYYNTKFISHKAKLYKYNAASSDKSAVLFDAGRLAEATENHVRGTMAAKRGDGNLPDAHSIAFIM